MDEALDEEGRDAASSPHHVEAPCQIRRPRLLRLRVARRRGRGGTGVGVLIRFSAPGKKWLRR